MIERHTSPDGSMAVLVDWTADECTIGFGGYAWHTHGEILNAWGYDGPPEVRTRAFLDDILQSRRVICVVRTDGKVNNIFVPDDLVDRPLRNSIGKYAPLNETTEFRYWNGEPAAE